MPVDRSRIELTRSRAHDIHQNRARPQERVMAELRRGTAQRSARLEKKYGTSEKRSRVEKSKRLGEEAKRRQMDAAIPLPSLGFKSS
jgi:hypothetical protein